jgi:hypothetical protein
MDYSEANWDARRRRVTLLPSASVVERSDPLAVVRTALRRGVALPFDVLTHANHPDTPHPVLTASLTQQNPAWTDCWPRMTLISRAMPFTS